MASRHMCVLVCAYMKCVYISDIVQSITVGKGGGREHYKCDLEVEYIFITT